MAIVPLGGIIAFAGDCSSAAVVAQLRQDGYLPCDGSSVSRTEFGDLFKVLDVRYGSDDGDTFKLPNLNGRTIIGVGTAAGLTTRALAEQLGSESESLAGSELPDHRHAAPSHCHRWMFPGGGADLSTGGSFRSAIRVGAGGGGGGLAGAEQPHANPSQNGGDGYYTEDQSGGNTGGPVAVGTGSPHNNMQPSLVLSYIIKCDITHG